MQSIQPLPKPLIVQGRLIYDSRSGAFALIRLKKKILEERQSLVQQGKQDNTLRIIIAGSDGEPDDPSLVADMAEKLGQLNTVVVGVGLTETAEKVPIIFNTHHSKGDLARNLEDLPAIVAKHVVYEAIKLFPERSKSQYQKSIDAILAKFNHVGVE